MRFGDANPVMAISFGNIPVEAMRICRSPKPRLLPVHAVARTTGPDGCNKEHRDDGEMESPRRTCGRICIAIISKSGG
jgi:hypothetical protein